MAKRTQPAAEEASHESGKLAQDLLGNFPALVYVVDADGRFLLTNKWLDTLLGVAAGQAISKTREDFLPAEIADEHRKNDLAVIRSGRSSISEEENIEPDGRHVYSSIKFPLHDARGRIYAIGGISTDITERKRIEHQLRKRTKELQALYSLAEIAEREDISLDELCQELADILPKGWQYPEMACAKIRIGAREFCTSNFAESPWKQSASVWVHGVVTGTMEVNYLDEKPDEDEGPFLKEERLLIDALAERLGRITERMKSEQTLRTSEERYHALFDESNDGIALADAVTGTILDCNAALCRMVERDKLELLGQPQSILHPPQQLVGGVSPTFRRHRTGTADESIEDDLISKSGKLVPIEIRAARVEIEGRSCLLGVFRDIAERRRAQGALREGERRYALALEAANDGIFDVDLRTGATHYSPRYAEMLGYGPTELVFSPQSGTWESLLHPDDKELALRALGRCLSGETEEYDEEFRLRTKAGDWCWIESRARVAERDPAGSPLRLVGSHRDITERKRAEEEIEALARFPAENPNPVLRVEERGAILYANPASESLLRCRVGGYLPPDWHEGVVGAAKDHARVTLDIRWEGRDYSILFAPIPGACYVNVYARDVTERRRAEEALRESEEHFRTLYENTTIGLYRTTPDGSILLANPTLVKMLGLTSLGALSVRNLEVDGFEPSYRRAQFLERVEREGTVTGLEATWTRADGISLFVREGARAIRDSDGKTLFYDGTVEDITERKKAQEALRESEDQYRSLVDNVPGIIFTIDLAGKLTFVSRRAKEGLGYESAEMINKSVLDFIPEEERQRAMEGIQKGMTGVGIKHFETSMIKGSGEHAWFECSFQEFVKMGE